MHARLSIRIPYFFSKERRATMNHENQQQLIAIEASSVNPKPMVEFLSSIEGGATILVFIIGFSIPSLILLYLGKTLVPALILNVKAVITEISNINQEIAVLSSSLKETCRNMEGFSSNLREASDKATTALASINTSLLLTNQHVSNLDTSLDVLKDTANRHTYSLDYIKENIRDLRYKVKDD